VDDKESYPGQVDLRESMSNPIANAFMWQEIRHLYPELQGGKPNPFLECLAMVGIICLLPGIIIHRIFRR